MTARLHKRSRRDGSGLASLLRTGVYALLIAVVFRALFYQPFSIPSGSMKPALLVGDYLFVSKFAYGYSRHTFPFSPSFLPDGRWPERTPERGDIIVFKLPRDGRTDYIKRLIGLPGDHVQIIRGAVHLNGKALPRVREGEFHEPYGKEGSTRCLRTEPGADGRMCVNARYRETLPNGRSYLVLNSDDETAYGTDNTPVFVVPAGHYFFLGDNRDNSVDSRFRSGVGMVPRDNLVGRAELIFLSSTGSALLPWEWRPERFLESLR